ncbi:MAG: hypothetical protein QM295_06145 [Bacillota bacterium]|jgi:hypothetical protein|nr:hypothetical protein [Bacillota bacterium]
MTVGKYKRKTLHPTKTKIVGLWDGKEGFDFLGMHFHKARAENAKGEIYYTIQHWLTKKAEKHITTGSGKTGNLVRFCTFRLLLPE